MKEITKSELKTGMILELADKHLYLVMLNTCFTYRDIKNVAICIDYPYLWINLDEYDDNLKNDDGYYDIKKVYAPFHCYTSIANENFMDRYALFSDSEYSSTNATEYQIKKSKPKDFYDDKEKMEDFITMSKRDFLDFYPHITEREYDLTMEKVKETLLAP